MSGDYKLPLNGRKEDRVIAIEEIGQAIFDDMQAKELCVGAQFSNLSFVPVLAIWGLPFGQRCRPKRLVRNKDDQLAAGFQDADPFAENGFPVLVIFQ